MLLLISNYFLLEHRLIGNGNLYFCDMNKVDKLKVFLNEGLADYVIMNGYNELEENTSDVDIMVPDVYLLDKKIKALATKFNYTLVQRMEHHIHAINYFVWDAENSVFISLDLYSKYIIKNKELFNYSDFSTNSLLHKGFKIPPIEIEFVYYWFKKIIKKDLSNKNFEVLKNLYFKNPTSINQLLSKINNQLVLPPDIFDDLEQYISFSEKITPIQYFKPSQDIGFKEIRRKIGRVLHPTGFSISFLGPDGSGKSTIIDELNSYDLPFRKRQYFHLIPVVQKSSTTNSDPHAKSPYNFFVSLGKLAFLFVKYWKGHLKLVKKMKIKSTFIIFDRYFDDLIVDPKRFRYGAPILFAKIIKLFIPKPDITIVLTGDPEIIQARKKEVDVHTCAKQIGKYNQLKGKRYYHVSVDTELPNIIVKEIIDNILSVKLSEKLN